LYLSSPSAASSRCVLLPTPTRHPYDAAAGSFQIGGVVPFPLVARAARARVERTASRALFLFIVDSRTCIRGFSVGEKEKKMLLNVSISIVFYPLVVIEFWTSTIEKKELGLREIACASRAFALSYRTPHPVQENPQISHPPAHRACYREWAGATNLCFG
jgi:hypothetical protein